MSERNQSGIKGREEGSGWGGVGGRGRLLFETCLLERRRWGHLFPEQKISSPTLIYVFFFFLCVRLSGRFDPMAAQRRIGRDLRPPARCWRNRRRKFGGIFLLLHPHPPPVNVFISADRWKWPFDPHHQVGA